ncbi:helix-turn-helix transcriptional regulator [Clostridium tagluense]|uniref:helix-turn-helix transcriptional regulator n=1 Tax=Clostridium tagluense TaxID=360422 RepID=UPI001CF467E2|nr:YafY family protein [Clostridium tagluense]MCB2297983.1 YafY family transcriptional regulator [Clostridium tagluense]
MRAERFLSISIIISQKGLVTGRALAEHFEVSLRTIYRDIEKISEAGVPIAATGGKGGGYYIMENYTLNNLFLNKKEIEPLIAVMDNLKFLFGNNPQFNDIVLKFETLRNTEKKECDNFSIDMSHFSMEKELREYLFLMNKAIEENRILEFEYINRKMEYLKRVVEPIQIEFTDGHWYIIAFCTIRKDYRKFKLVRVRNMKLGGVFKKNLISKEEIKKIFSESYEKNSILVTLKFSSEIGGQLSEYFSKEKITLLENGTYIVEDFFPEDEGLKKFILGFGNDCEVIGPDKLRKKMVEYIKNIYSKYND